MTLNNIRHPRQSARKAKSWFTAHLHMWRFGNHGRRRFQNDSRYKLQNVTEGFADHIDEGSDDTLLLDRICAAFNKAEERGRSMPGPYLPSQPLQSLRQGRLGPSIRALREHDTAALGKMYRNFYRDPCSAGLMGAPAGMPQAYFSGHIKDIYRHFYLSHVLYRLDYWKELTGGRFSLNSLAGPGIGNPYGVVMDGTHIGVGSEYSHYCAQRVASLIDRRVTPQPAIGEIGGGFGAMAYYLLRDHRPLNYFDFDVPERIALSSYYLMKAFPDFTFLLYGEDTTSSADVVLMPISALADMPHSALDIAFSSNAIANLAPAGRSECLQTIGSITRQSLLSIGNEAASEWHAELVEKGNRAFSLTDNRTSGWHSHKVSGAGVGGAAALADSTLLEQTFSRKSITAHSVVSAPIFPAGIQGGIPNVVPHESPRFNQETHPGKNLASPGIHSRAAGAAD